MTVVAPHDIIKPRINDWQRTVSMKRASLIKHLQANGAYLLREGKRHSIYQRENLKTEVPRHSEIVDELARKICKDLGIPFVR
jgi:mRNA interferase HicA